MVAILRREWFIIGKHGYHITQKRNVAPAFYGKLHIFFELRVEILSIQILHQCINAVERAVHVSAMSYILKSRIRQSVSSQIANFKGKAIITDGLPQKDIDVCCHIYAKI